MIDKERRRWVNSDVLPALKKYSRIREDFTIAAGSRNFPHFRKLVYEGIDKLFGKNSMQSVNELAYVILHLWYVSYDGRLTPVTERAGATISSKIFREISGTYFEWCESIHSYMPRETPKTTKENTMNQAPKQVVAPSIDIQTITYVNRQDVRNMTDEQFVSLVRSAEDEIRSLVAINTPSVRIEKNIESKRRSTRRAYRLVRRSSQVSKPHAPVRGGSREVI